MAREDFHSDAHPDATDITGDRDYGEWGQCVASAKSTGERCKQPAKGSHGKCGTHGGDTPDKDENPNVGADEGNQNAMKTGIHSDPMNLFDWLVEHDEQGAAYILGKLHDYSEHAPREVFVLDVTADEVETFDDVTAKLTAYGDDLLTTCVRDYARKRAEYIQLTEGIITEQERATESGAVTIEDSNPVNIDLDRFDRQQMSRKDKLGLLPDDSDGVDAGVVAQMWDDLTSYYEGE